MFEVSILLPSWNGVDYLQRCLASIIRNRACVDLELIAVDNASTDGAAELLRHMELEHPWIRCIYNSQNLLFARACNQAYALSSAPWLLVVNNDIELEPRALRRLLDHGLAHPDVGVVSPRFVLPDGTFQEAYRRLPTAAMVIAHYHPLGRAVDRLLLRRRLQSRYFYRDLRFDGVVEVEQAGASCSLLRREAVEDAGGLFDESFPLLFNDVDLSARLAAGGWHSVVLSEVRVLHHDGIASRLTASTEYHRHLMSGLFQYFRRHRPASAWILGLLWPFHGLATRRGPAIGEQPRDRERTHVEAGR